MSFLIPTALAATTDATTTATNAHAQSGGSLSFLLFIGVFFLFFYFFLIRPQSKRQKEMKQMLAAVSTGDEVVIAGGILGVVASLHENIASIEISKGVEIKVQKTAIVACLPKGTVQS